MRKLPTQFRQQGRTLLQLRRGAKTAIYKLIGQQGLLYGYEVLRIAIKQESQCFGVLLPEREVYPSSCQFGKIAWSYGTQQMEQAYKKFDMLVRLEQQTVPVYDPRAFTDHSRELEAACN
jgi:hypothetical protein